MDYLALFMEYLQVELGLSDNTRISYQRDLRIFCKALSISEDKLADVQRSQIIGYITKLKLQGRAAATIARKLAAIKAFYRFMITENYLQTDPAEAVEAGTKGVHLPKVLTEAEVRALLEAPDLSSAEGLRDRTMLEMLYATGMRVSELVTVKTASVNLSMRYVIAFGKGSKERIVPLGSVAAEYLQRYDRSVIVATYDRRPEEAAAELADRLARMDGSGKQDISLRFEKNTPEYTRDLILKSLK